MFGGPGYLTYPSFIKALSEVSYYRGGSELYGSAIWADLMEQGELENQIPSIVQVFGHTMVRDSRSGGVLRVSLEMCLLHQ